MKEPTAFYKCLTVFFLFALLPLSGQTSLDEFDSLLSQAGFEENWEARQGYGESIKAPFFSMMHVPASIYDQVISPVPVKFELRRGETAFYLLFINGREGDFPTLGRGNWIIKRDMRTGEYIQAKIFLQNDAETFIRLYPGEDRSHMDIFLYGHQIYSHIPVPVAFGELLLSPFSRLLSLTENIIAWESLLTSRDYEEWALLELLSEQLKWGAADLEYVDDGGMNEMGEWVYIETGLPQKEETPGVNCSGFLKWAADGFYSNAPFAVKKRFSFDELRFPPSGWEGEESSWDLNFDNRDSRFGLDWTRNISSRLRQAFTNLETSYGHMDVDRVPFYDYKEEVGYVTADLDTILYLLAVNSPGRIYWGAVSAPYKPEGESVTLWQYYHTALFVPRFSDEGDFICDVFQSGNWTSLEIFLDQYGGTWTHLSESDGLRPFTPPSIP